MKKVILYVLLFVFVSAAAAAAEDLYVQSVKAKVMSQPTFKATVLAEVAKGHKFTATDKKGSWRKVVHGGKEAYVSSLLLSPNPPMAKVGLIKGENTEIKQDVRRRASTYTSAAAARGLAADDRRRMSTEVNADFHALEKIEAFSVNSDELTKFAEGGK